MRNIIIIIGKIIAITLLLFAAAVHFRLGYLLPIVLVVGLVLSILSTISNQAALNKKYLAPFFVTASYLLFSWLAWQVFIIQKFTRTHTEQVHAMAWENKGNENHIGESEITFQFVEFPGNYHGVFSNKVANYLEDLPMPSVDVTFEISRDFGCWGGYRVIRIGELTQMEYRDGYARGGITPKGSPWDEFYGKWWCP